MEDHKYDNTFRERVFKPRPHEKVPIRRLHRKTVKTSILNSSGTSKIREYSELDRTLFGPMRRPLWCTSLLSVSDTSLSLRDFKVPLSRSR